MKFVQVKKLNIPEGIALKISHNGKQLWKRTSFVYVSLGDSIAAGHLIRHEDRLNLPLCYEWQYGTAGVKSTEIIADSYTDLIRKKLVNDFKELAVSKSYARSGDWVEDLLDKLNDETIKAAIREANIVTLCIGANDIMQPALSYFDDYVANGQQTLEAMGTTVQNGLNNLASKSNTSYYALINTLYNLNKNATYVFTTVYNPYKYLWLEESTKANNYKDGFLGPLMWSIPDTVGDTIANSIRGAFLNTNIVKTIFNRINAIPSWVETYITKLNEVMYNAIADYKRNNPDAKFLITDTKKVFDSIPDRTVGSGKHYNDAVNVEVTRGYNIQELDWSQFWDNIDWGSILTNMESVASDIMNNILNNVILPDIDPHPETYGHEALYRSFADALGWQPLTRYTITYNANGGSGSMATQEVVGLETSVYTVLKANTFSPNSSIYRFVGWKDQNGNTYSDEQSIFLTSDLTLTAQWDNSVIVKYMHSQGDVIQSDLGQTGPMDCYELWVAGTDNNNAGNPEGKLGAFSNPPVYYNVPYGTRVGVVAKTDLGKGRSYITLNNSKVAGTSSSATYEFTVTSNTVINFEWNQWISTDPSDYLTDLGQVSYWNCYITTS